MSELLNVLKPELIALAKRAAIHNIHVSIDITGVDVDDDGNVIVNMTVDESTISRPRNASVRFGFFSTDKAVLIENP